MTNKRGKKQKRSAARLSSQTLVATGAVEGRAANALRMKVDDWTVLLEWEGSGKARGEIERGEGVTLVHFDLPTGALGEYHISVQQPFIDIQCSWAGTMDCWRGTELTSIALNYDFDTAANSQMPVICNYDRSGENRGVIGMLDHVYKTHVNQRPILEEPPMHLLQTRFTRNRRVGGVRETVVLGREKGHFVQALRRFFALCRMRQGIVPLAAPDWAREPVWCSWYSHLYLLTQRDVEKQIPYLQKLGVRTVIVDASWFKKPEEALHRESGDYVPNLAAYPDMRGLARRLHDVGLKLMLWCAPFYLGIHAKKRAALEHFCIWDGKERDYRLCPFSAEAVTHVRALAEHVMRDYELDGLKVDFLDDMGPACVDPRHDHGDNYGAAVCRLMAAIRDGVMGVNANAAIEYRLNYSTLATQPYATCHRGNDAPYDADYMRRENLFLRLFCEYPAAIWNDYAYWHARETPENIGLMLGTQIFSGGVPTLSLDLTKVGVVERRVMEKWMRFYGRHRETLARAQLHVHSADSFFSVSSLQNMEEKIAFVLLAGSHVPARIELQRGVETVWVLNASAEKSGNLRLTAGGKSTDVRLAGRAAGRIQLSTS